MTEAEAITWVREHDDSDELDETELRDAFTAIYDRLPDSEDERIGLWSLVCAGVD